MRFISVFYGCTVHVGSHEPYVAIKLVKCVQFDLGTEFLITFKLNWIDF